MSLFRDEIPSWAEYLIPAGHSLYDHVIADSGVERDFVTGLEANAAVKLYVKLPAWFTVPTPVGDYNPDWAIVMERRDQCAQLIELLYLVRETKSTPSRDDLRPDERRKIQCGEAHLRHALNVNYKTAITAAKLP